MKVALLIVAVASLASTSAVHLPVPLTYFRAVPVTTLTSAAARKLFTVPVLFGADIPGVRYVKDGRPDRVVATCRQYELAERAGFEPQLNFDIVMSGFLVRACGLLDAAIRARPARRSFVDAPRIGVGDIDQISSAVLPLAPWEPGVESPAEYRQRERRSIAAFAREQHCRRVEATALELRLICDGDILYSLTELLRADVDGSGTQSIVVAPYLRSMTGTLADPEPVVALSRTSTHALLVPHPLPPAIASGN